MEFRKLRIKDLIPASYNPRKKLKPGDKEFEKIKNSITEFGYVEPIIVTLMLVLPDLSHRRLSSYLIRCMIKKSKKMISMWMLS